MQLRQIQIVCGVLAAGLLVASIVLGGLAYARVISVTPGLLPPLAGAVALAFPACLLVGIAVRASMLQQVRVAWLREGQADAAESIGRFEEAYARALLVQCSALEGFGLLGAACALVTGQLLFLVAPAMAIVGIGLVFPTEAKFRAVTDRLTRPAEERESRWLEAMSGRE